MAANNTFIMVGLGLAGLWFMNRQRGSQEDQAGQLTGAAMQASGEGTWPASPWNGLGQLYSFMPGTNVPLRATSDEDIGIYRGGVNRPALEFTVEKTVPAAGTSDTSLTTRQFEGSPAATVTASTIWDQQALIAQANFMPLLAIQDVQGISILQSDVDIATLTSTDKFRGVNVTTGDVFTTTGAVLGEYTTGWQAARAAAPAPAYVPQTWQQIEAASGLTARQAASGLTSRQATSPPWVDPYSRQQWDLHIGI